MKKFSELRESLLKNKEEEENKAKGPFIRAKGEQDFAKDHEYPVDPQGKNNKAYPTKNADNVLNARSAKKTNMHDPKEDRGALNSKSEKKVSQGSSTVGNPFGFKGSRTATNANAAETKGDTNIVRLSKSAVQPVLEDVAYGKETVQIVFENGDSGIITPKSAKKLLETYQNLNPENAERFAENLNESMEGFIKMMKFANA